jgi:hypothetical protein
VDVELRQRKWAAEKVPVDASREAASPCLRCDGPVRLRRRVMLYCGLPIRAKPKLTASCMDSVLSAFLLLGLTTDIILPSSKHTH